MTNVSTTLMPKRRRWVRPAVAISVALSILVIGGKIACDRFIEYAMRPYCANDMRQITLGAIMYAQSHGGQFPDDLQTVFESQDVGNAVWYCIAANHGVGVSPDQETVRADIQSGNIGYIWIGKGVTTRSESDVVVLYDKPMNHAGRGMNVAFADGHIEWIGPEDMKHLLEKIATGERPIHFTATKPPATQP